jgi:hypothetical protein
MWPLCTVVLYIQVKIIRTIEKMRLPFIDSDLLYRQGRIHVFALGGTKVWNRLRTPADPGQSTSRGSGDEAPPGSSRVLSI